MSKSTNTGRWSLCIIPSSLIPAPTLYAVDVLRGEHTYTRVPSSAGEKSDEVRAVQVYHFSGKCTYHLRLLPPRTKSSLVHSVVEVGDHPVNVAKLAETLNLGVSARVSKSLKSGSWFLSGVYTSVNFLSTCTGGAFPVMIS